VRLKGGEVVSLRRPWLEFTELAYGPLNTVLISPRVSPHVAGLGLLEAVPSEVLEQRALEAKPDGVRGAVNWVWDRQTEAPVVGRFGLKANAPTLRQQIAGAFLGDMGITSSLFPIENCTPVQSACKKAASNGSPELNVEQLNAVEFYIAHLAPPRRRNADQPQVMQGEAIFARSGCTVCHQPELRSGTHPRFPLLSGQPVEAYSDLLLHDMGAALADGRPDYQANGRQWRTTPLWGFGLLFGINEHTSYLHDGRARTAQEAILWHGGEAAVARNRYEDLSKSDRNALLAFVQSL
jgi:CxxC motif-containing protein (DUF1111 family)